MQYFSLFRLCSVFPTETAVPLMSAENKLADFERKSAIFRFAYHASITPLFAVS